MGNYMFKNTHGTQLTNRHKKQKKDKKAISNQEKFDMHLDLFAGIYKDYGVVYKTGNENEFLQISTGRIVTAEQLGIKTEKPFAQGGFTGKKIDPVDYELSKKSPIMFFEVMEKYGYQFPQEIGAFLIKLEQDKPKESEKGEQMEYREHPPYISKIHGH